LFNDFVEHALSIWLFGWIDWLIALLLEGVIE
jgi:hypothetical protein